MASGPRRKGESLKKYHKRLRAEEVQTRARLRGRLVYNCNTEHQRLTHGAKAIERKPAKAVMGEEGVIYV